MTTVNKIIPLFSTEDDSEGEGNNPFVVSFDSVPHAEILESTGSKRSSNGRISCFERPQKRQRSELGAGDKDAEDDPDFLENEKVNSDDDVNGEEGDDTNIDVVAETDKIVFHGTTTGRTTLPLRHAIGIKNSETGELTLVEVPPVVALHKFMKLGEADLAEDVSIEAGEKIGEGEYVKYRNNLTEVFGNYKKKLQIRAATANALPDKISDIAEENLKETREAVKIQLKEDENKPTFNDLPKYSTTATMPKDAYKLSSLARQEILDEVFTIVAELEPLVSAGLAPLAHKFAELCVSLSAYVTERLKTINTVPKKRIRDVLTCLVLVKW